MKLRTDSSGWFAIGDTFSNDYFEISEANIDEILQRCLQDDIWAEGVNKAVERYDNNPWRGTAQWFSDMISLMNSSGTLVDYPFGTGITFQSRRHFFRGEPEKYWISDAGLCRACRKRKLTGKSAELYKAVADMRVCQFKKFIWRFHIVPYWEAKISDVNYKALAQHYGFETALLDLTNDFRVALFFATCKYIWEKDTFEPLTREDFEREPDEYGDPRYGVIFHSPNWMLDFLNGGVATIGMGQRFSQNSKKNYYSIDGGVLDGVAFQIGYQPFYRCQYQSGFAFPMRNEKPLQENTRFEKLVFKHSEELSSRVFEMMKGGELVFPNEGISKALPVLRDIQKSVLFSEDDALQAYEIDEASREHFPTFDDFLRDLRTLIIDGQQIQIQKEEVTYKLRHPEMRRINKLYDQKNLGKMIGRVHYTAPQRRRREERCRQIYGRLID